MTRDKSMTQRSAQRLDRSEIRFAVPKSIDIDDKDIAFIVPRRDSMRITTFSKFEGFSSGLVHNMVRVNPIWLSKTVEAIYAIVIKQSNPKMNFHNNDGPKKLVPIQLPKRIEGVVLAAKIERSKYLHLQKKISPMFIERYLRVDYQKIKDLKSLLISNISIKTERENRSTTLTSPHHSKSATLGLTKKKVPSYTSHNDKVFDELREKSIDSIRASARSGEQESMMIAAHMPPKPIMKDKQLSTENIMPNDSNSIRQLTTTDYNSDPISYLMEMSNSKPKGNEEKKKPKITDFTIPVNIDSIRLDTDTERHMNGDFNSLAINTNDLKIDLGSQLAKSQSVNPMSSANHSSTSYIIPGNLLDLMKAMKQNMELGEAMKVKFVDQRVTRPIETIEKTEQPLIPRFSVHLKNHLVSNQSLKELVQLSNNHAMKTYNHPDKVHEKDDPRNSVDNASQKTKSFRIKEAKRGGPDSINPSPQSGALRQSPEMRRASQRSDSSDKTKKGTKNSVRSMVTADITEREQANNAEVKKLEPLITKYNDCNKWSSDKDRLRMLVAEQLKLKSPFLSGFSSEFIGTLLSIGQFGFFTKDSMLFNEGDTSDRMGIVMYGIVKYSLRDSIVTLTHGGMICEECLFSLEAIKMESSVVLAKTCVLWLPSNCLQELRIFCDNAKKKNEYVLFVANIQKQIKQKS